MERKHLKDELIILKRFPVNENDLLISAYGKTLGRISIKAKGSKKITSKFTGRLEPLSQITSEIYFSGKSYTLTNAEILNKAPMSPNLKCFEATQEICTILNQTLANEEENRECWQLLSEIIESLGNSNKEQEILIYFFIRYLKISGHLPALNTCYTCHEKHTQSAHLDQYHHIQCHKCIKRNKVKAQRISMNTLKVMHFFRECKNLDHALRVKIPEKQMEELTDIIRKMTLTSFDIAIGY